MQAFKRERSGLLSSLLILALIGLLVSALFNYTERIVLGAPNAGLLDERLSLSVAVVLILVYIGNLVRDGARGRTCVGRARGYS